jgi:ADP-heptose:LPS heptosyltransferase
VAAGRYLAERGWALAVLAGPGEEGVAQAIVDDLPAGSAACFGTRHLKQVAALLSRCGLLLCNDTGLMHLSAAVGTPPVAIFGPTSPAIYAPRSAFPVGGRDPECSCRRTDQLGPPECVASGRCLRGTRPCIEQVSVDEVVAALERALYSLQGAHDDRGTRSQSTAEPG